MTTLDQSQNILDMGNWSIKPTVQHLKATWVRQPYLVKNVMHRAYFYAHIVIPGDGLTAHCSCSACLASLVRETKGITTENIKEELRCDIH